MSERISARSLDKITAFGVGATATFLVGTGLFPVSDTEANADVHEVICNGSKIHEVQPGETLESVIMEETAASEAGAPLTNKQAYGVAHILGYDIRDSENGIPDLIEFDMSDIPAINTTRQPSLIAGESILIPEACVSNITE